MRSAFQYRRIRPIVALTTLAGCLIIMACAKMKYPPGRDTIEAFGDGRYAVMRTPEKGKCMFDAETQTTISASVVSWKREGNLVCVLAAEPKRFVLVDYVRGTVAKYEQLEEIPLPQRPIFERLSKP